jgi:hypothetical protein
MVAGMCTGLRGPRSNRPTSKIESQKTEEETCPIAI